MAAIYGAEILNLGSGLIKTGLGALGIGLGKVTLDKVKEIIKSSNFDSTLDNHSLHKKHNFNDWCGPQCIEKVQNQPKEIVDYGMPKAKNVFVILIRGNCQHGCTIQVNLVYRLDIKKWEISTAFHVPEGVCLAKKCAFKK